MLRRLCVDVATRQCCDFVLRRLHKPMNATSVLRLRFGVHMMGVGGFGVVVATVVVVVAERREVLQQRSKTHRR